MNKSHAAYAEVTAEQFIEFIKLADDDEVLEAFCRRFELLVDETQRKRIERLLAMLNTEFLPKKEVQKRGSDAVNKDSPATSNVSVFGAKAGSKTFVIDEMLASGRYTLAEIENESKASIETIKRRIRKLKSLGYLEERDVDGKTIVYYPLIKTDNESVEITATRDDTAPVQKKKRKRKRK